MSKFGSFEVKKSRPLPVFFLVDTSGSMRGEKIEKVNLAFKEMIRSFSNVKNARGDIEVSVITFGGKVELLQVLKPVDEVGTLNFSAKGNTPMGEAFELVTNMIEDRGIVSEKAFIPIIVLVSDGIPTDLPVNLRKSKSKDEFLKWEGLQKMQSSRRTSKSIKLGLSIGTDANKEMLKAFINNSNIALFKAKEVNAITKFFEWVTMSISVRSINPENEVVFSDEDTLEDMFESDDYEF